MRSFLAQMLADGGHRTLQAVHGAEALELVGKERPDLVVSDVMMPVLNGAELCRRLKAGSDPPLIPVILMSAAGPRVADGTGADAVIAKPFDLADMEALVERWSSPNAGAKDTRQGS